ncbi:hypothetical protein [Marinobacter sp.]|uniref:hypothetical protein n=1 Tax=Marinobacter sp. TaxID=50741 RepID=UPI00261DBC64|nr:hypothetical protein [Marinobacter sp.]
MKGSGAMVRRRLLVLIGELVIALLLTVGSFIWTSYGNDFSNVDLGIENRQMAKPSER